MTHNRSYFRQKVAVEGQPEPKEPLSGESSYEHDAVTFARKWPLKASPNQKNHSLARVATSMTQLLSPEVAVEGQPERKEPLSGESSYEDRLPRVENHLSGQLLF